MYKENTSWHNIELNEVIQSLKADCADGLSREDVVKRQNEFGLNSFESRKSKGPFISFLEQFKDPLIYILIGASILTIFVKDFKDALIIFSVVLINALIGYIQESKAEKATEALSKSMTKETAVIREGKVDQVNVQELVPGDIVLFSSGDQVPADLRIVEGKDIQVAEAALTGESLSVDKNHNSVLEEDISLGDRINMLYASTLITNGQGKGIVVATGQNTEIGRISQLISNVKNLDTPLTRKIARFSNLLLYLILGISIFAILIGLIRGSSFVDMLMAAVALAVGMIPEGLPAALTITLAIGVSKMAKRNAIVRKLAAVETLGSTSVICSDKTGTLTQNQMTVQSIWAGKTIYELTNIGYSPNGQILCSDGKEIIDINSHKSLKEVLHCGMLCNDSNLIKGNQNTYIPQGDPTEVALVVSALKGKIDENNRKHMPILDKIPFNSTIKYMATLHEGENENVLYIKGSLESVLKKCTLLNSEFGKPVELDAELNQQILKQAEDFSSEGMRVLSFAKMEVDSSKREISEEDIENAIFLGLQVMIDPPRPEAITAIEHCQKAGVKVKMITGDHPLTAIAIAKKLGIEGAEKVNDLQHSTQYVLTGSDLTKIENTKLPGLVEDVIVFARVSPEQKLRIVEALQEKKHVVAMTGDGVNDAPALKQADIGVAMGITGTDVSREASDMILTDDNFSSIESAVEEGRCVYDNLVKLLSWILPTNLGAGLIILVSILGGFELPLLPIHVLWINMTSAGVLGLSLAFEGEEGNIMARLPRSSDSAILPPRIVSRIIFVGLLILASAFFMFQYELQAGNSLENARTVVINVIMFVMTFYLLNSRSLTDSIFKLGLFSNPWVIFSIIFIVLLQLGFTYLPFMNSVMYSAPLDPSEWLKIFGIATLSFLIVEVEKKILPVK
ncbi:MAG: HAD-IC family P-type ATPase [Candidatus Caenarcaniphilales bacterium]|nr:HAD-IC family P-type ATPase [Candidatus Caenarcaniphilales bacterium]